MPTTLSITTSSFPAAERGKAVGAWIGVAGAGAIFGLLTSGLLLEWFSWPSIFVFGGLLAVGTLVAAVAVIPDSARRRTAYRRGQRAALLDRPRRNRLRDPRRPHRGCTDAATLVAYAVGLLAGALWLGWRLRISDPMLDPRLFRVRGLATGVLSISVKFFVFFGMVFIVLQYPQLILDYTGLQAGLAMTPMGMVLGGLSRRAPHIVGRIGQHRTAGIGLVLIAAGVLVLSRLGADSSYWLVLAGLLPGQYRGGGGRPFAGPSRMGILAHISFGSTRSPAGQERIGAGRSSERVAVTAPSQRPSAAAAAQVRRAIDWCCGQLVDHRHLQLAE